MEKQFHPFKDMKESAKAQHEVDKANFQAAKIEAKVQFEENRGSRTFQKAKEDARESWNNAKLSHSEQKMMHNQKLEEQKSKAESRKALADARLKDLQNN